MGVMNGIYGNAECGVGFVIIPDGVDPEIYKANVFRTGRISIFGGYGHSNFYDILIDSEALQEIVFPTHNSKYGTPVVWLNIPHHNQPIVIGTLTYDEQPNNAKEFCKKITRRYKESLVNFEMDAKEGRINISVNSKEKKAKFEIMVNSKNDDSEFIIKIGGKTIIHSTDKIIAISQTSIETVVTDIKGKVLAKTRISSKGTERFLYEDEYKNKITATSEGLEANYKNRTITINDSGITIEALNDDIEINAGDNVIQMTDSGINIDSGKSSVTVNGSNEVLYSKVPGLKSIDDVSQIGISKTVKVGS